jgi:hypothetical protein
MENLFIVVRHPLGSMAKESKYKNEWIEDWKLISIETKKSLIKACEEYNRHQWVYIYRTALNKIIRRESYVLAESTGSTRKLKRYISKIMSELITHHQ